MVATQVKTGPPTGVGFVSESPVGALSLIYLSSRNVKVLTNTVFFRNRSALIAFLHERGPRTSLYSFIRGEVPILVIYLPFGVIGSNITFWVGKFTLLET